MVAQPDDAREFVRCFGERPVHAARPASAYPPPARGDWGAGRLGGGATRPLGAHDGSDSFEVALRTEVDWSLGQFRGPRGLSYLSVPNAVSYLNGNKRPRGELVQVQLNLRVRVVGVKHSLWLMLQDNIKDNL